MKFAQLFLFLIVALLSTSAFGQRKEINPNIDAEWRFVRSQELNLLSGSFYSFEFPAERGYDYIFNLSHELNGVYAAISVFDMQDQKIATITANESNSSADLNFDVKSSGTYKVVLGVTDPAAQKGNSLPSHLNLIRRVKI